MSPRPSGRADAGTARICQLNDIHRRRAVNPFRGRAYLTPGVRTLPIADLIDVLHEVRHFSDFTADNDPHGEHDFGAFDRAGVRYFWKIDYYDLERQGPSPDPANPKVTRRVLTIMRADEY